MDHDCLLRELEALETVGQVIRWALARTPRARFVDEVVQDELTRDVVVRVVDDLHAVFDITCLGVVTGVDLWDRKPGANELLALRLERGWKPTPTATRDGDVVLGYAAGVGDRRREACRQSGRSPRLAGAAN
jgi:hypothetical protein